jgi:hypothetical protein
MADVAYAHNTARSGPNQDVPVILDGGPAPDDIENWHVATDAEYAAYQAYWDSINTAPFVILAMPQNVAQAVENVLATVDEPSKEIVYALAMLKGFNTVDEYVADQASAGSPA